MVAQRLIRRRSGRSSDGVDPTADAVRRSLPLTVPASNWQAWSGRPLRLEVEALRVRASLPMAMATGDASRPPIPHGCFAGCEFTTGLYGLAEPDEAGGAVLAPTQGPLLGPRQ